MYANIVTSPPLSSAYRVAAAVRPLVTHQPLQSIQEVDINLPSTNVPTNMRAHDGYKTAHHALYIGQYHADQHFPQQTFIMKHSLCRA